MTERTTAETGLEEFDRGWLETIEKSIEQTPYLLVELGLAGLTRLGERPASLDRFAGILHRSTEDAAVLLRENRTARIENGLIHWDDPFPGDRVIRTIQIGGREVPMKSGCAPDLFGFAAILDIPFTVEDTCATTGTPIRVAFVPNGYERVDPAGAVTLLLPPEDLGAALGAGSEEVNFEEVNAKICAHQPFFASAQAAEPALAARPGSRVFTVKDMFDRPFITYCRDEVRPLIHPSRDRSG
jgi:alkylmercury lyase